MISGDSKGIKSSLVSLKVGHNRQCTFVISSLVKILIGHKYYVRHLNETILKYISSGSSSTMTSRIIMCNHIHGQVIKCL